MAFEKDHFLAREKKRIALERAQKVQQEYEYENLLVLEPKEHPAFPQQSRPLTHIPHDIRPTMVPSHRNVLTVAAPPEQGRDLLPGEKALVYTLQFLAYAVPFFVFSYIIYLNVLPFGYTHTSRLIAGTPSDLAGELRLLPSPNLSSRVTAADNSTYRELNGFGSALLQLKSALHNATAAVSIVGDGAFLLPQVVATSTNENFANRWVFKDAIPQELSGTAYIFDGCARFDGANILESASTSASFENGPLSIFAEWKPDDNVNDFQEIIGHYNWEFMQNSDSVVFQVGRMNNATSGPFYSVKYKVGDDFFGQRHTALATYAPGIQGHIELAVDGKIVGRTNIGTSTISTDYNQFHNLTFGEKIYIGAPFKGCIYSAGISELNAPESKPQQLTIPIPDDVDTLTIPFAGYDGKIRSIEVKVSQP